MIDFRLTENDQKVMDEVRRQSLVCREYARYYEVDDCVDCFRVVVKTWIGRQDCCAGVAQAQPPRAWMPWQSESIRVKSC